MGKNDFFSNEKSVTVPEATTAKIEFVGRRRHGDGAEGKDPAQGR